MTDQASISGRASPDANALQAPHWERALLEKAVLAAVREQRASRRWKIFFRLFFLLISGLMAWYLIAFSNDNALARGAHAALIVLDGEIAADQQTNAERLNAALQAEVQFKRAWSTMKSAVYALNIQRSRSMQPRKIYALRAPIISRWRRIKSLWTRPVSSVPLVSGRIILVLQV